MKRVLFLRIRVFIIISVICQAGYIKAQISFQDIENITVTGWIDDTHYILRYQDIDEEVFYSSVNIRSGKSVEIAPPETDRDRLIASLPEGTDFTDDDVVSPDMESIVLLKDNDLFLFIEGMKGLRRLTDDSISEVNARFSPDSKKLAYTKNKDLYVFDLTLGKEIRLTHDASSRIYNGYASWVYMEEILGRSSRYAAFWWSPDSRKLAFLRSDETDIPIFTLNRLDEPDGIHGQIEETPYPKAGDPTPKVKMGIVDLSSEDVTWVKTDGTVDQYLAWPFWTPDSRELAIQVVNRDQNEIRIILADAETGSFSQIYHESRKSWIEFYQDIYVLRDGSGFIVRSYRDDWENLYYHGWDGRLIARLTDFNFRVTDIERVDEEVGVVYFCATGEESTDQHLYRVGLDGRELLQVTNGAGTHDVLVSPKGNYFIDTWNSIESPGSIVAINKRGRIMREIYSFVSSTEAPSDHSSGSEMFTIISSDGLFEMPAVITYPVGFDSTRKYPVIFDIYGGPGSKNVTNRWQGDTPSWYAQNGIIVFTVDHRGSGHFGKRGLDYMYRSLGKWEILDYEDGVKWLLEKSFVDKKRIGITGSSYGGYMTCLALTKGADYWTHGFAIAPVTDWRLYDNIYTERFMDIPEDNRNGYKDGSVLTFVDDFKGELYLTHGDMDDNVHMQNSIYLISKLQDAGKSFRFMLYPGGRHGWGGKKAIHLRNELHTFWKDSFFGN